MTTVAILGAQGQIARSLLAHLPADWRLVLFSRDPSLPHGEAEARQAEILPYADFPRGVYDLVINAAGPGDPGAQRSLGRQIFRITETFDNLVLDYLEAHSTCAYVNISTGAVFGPSYDRQGFTLDPAALGSVNSYVLAKLVAETKHRQSAHLRIADLRVFGYFTRHIDLASQFFVAQAVAHARSGQVFATSQGDFLRDFVAPEDLAAQIVALQTLGVPNGGYNALSAAPVTKFVLLDALTEKLGLKYRVDGGEPQRLVQQKSVTLVPERVNILPNSRLTSLQLVLREAGVLYVSAPPPIDVSIHGNS